MEAAALQIRPAIASDAAGIADVHAAGWRFAYRGKLPQSFLDSLSNESRTRFWQHAITNPLPRSITLVAVQQDRSVGFCNCGPSRNPEASDTHGEVAAIHVDPALTRQGIGRRLMDASLNHLARQQFHSVELWVLDSNEIGRNFYEQTGWTTDGTAKTDTIGGVEVREIRYIRNLEGERRA